MDQKEVPREKLDLRENPEILSPPIILEPLYRCATTVTVLGFVPHAEIDVEIDGMIVATVIASYSVPNGETINLPNPLNTGQQVRARQRTSTTQSVWSASVTVRDHTQDYPAGPPRPHINPAPVYQCGSRTGVSNLLTGGSVWITADGAEVGRVNGCSEHQGVNVSPDYGLNQRVRAWFELCGDPSPPSLEHTTQPPPTPLPTPGIDTAYEDGEQLRVTNIVNGARVTVYRNGANQGTWRCWGYALLLDLNPPFSAGETLEASQAMCPGDPGSPNGSTVVEPCSALPAPLVGPVQIGDDRITVVLFVPDAVIKVYVNLVKAGEGSGPVIFLNKTIKNGDTIHVQQVLGKCEGATVREVQPSCIAPLLDGDPSGFDLFPVGSLDYAKGDIKGSVYYPADDDGPGQPFNRRLAEVRRASIVFMAHGNHGTHHDPVDIFQEWAPNCGIPLPPGWIEIPNHKGYDYFQQTLAKMGIIAVSVDCNATNMCGGGPSNIEDRADLIIGSIDHFQTLNADAGSIFHNHIDFGAVGLMGHSRGGDAVVLVPEVISLPNVTIKCVIALAPTSFGPTSGQPKGYAFMTILPAGDGDVSSNDGAKFYDQAQPEPYKSQLYVHYGNHNFFNRQWPQDDGNGPPVMSRHDHEQVLSVYGCALFRNVLLGHGGTDRFLSGRLTPASVMAANVHLSFERKDAFTVDNHEDGNGIGLNSLNLQTMQMMGLNANEFAFRQGTGAFNGSFFGNSTGMVTQCQRVNGQFRSPLGNLTDLTDRELWIRVAEVFEGQPLPAGATGLELGLEDNNGIVVWVSSDGVGGLPRPYERPTQMKTMLKTLRFPGKCFEDDNPEFQIKQVSAILLRCPHDDKRALAFDDLQIVPKQL
jgi:hypothetical protein